MSRHTHNSDAGPTQRQLRVGEVIRRAIFNALMRGETHEPELEGRSITVTEVRCTPDLKIATVYVMPLGGVDGEAVVKALARARGELRRHVGKATGLKFTPDLRFRLDETYDQYDDTRRLLNRDEVKRDL